MPNDMVPFAPMVAADSTQPLPSLVAQALRQAEADHHPDVPWKPPATLPGADALQVALAMLTPRPADDRTIASCMAAMVIAFEPNTKLSPEATRLRFTVWKEANADLGNALWQLATERAIRGLRWMPKPAELREQVRAELDARALRHRRCRQMLEEGARRRNARRWCRRRSRSGCATPSRSIASTSASPTPSGCSASSMTCCREGPRHENAAPLRPGQGHRARPAADHPAHRPAVPDAQRADDGHRPAQAQGLAVHGRAAQAGRDRDRGALDPARQLAAPAHRRRRVDRLDHAPRQQAPLSPRIAKYTGPKEQ